MGGWAVQVASEGQLKLWRQLLERAFYEPQRRSTHASAGSAPASPAATLYVDQLVPEDRIYVFRPESSEDSVAWKRAIRQVAHTATARESRRLFHQRIELKTSRHRQGGEASEASAIEIFPTGGLTHVPFEEAVDSTDERLQDVFNTAEQVRIVPASEHPVLGATAQTAPVVAVVSEVAGMAVTSISSKAPRVPSITITVSAPAKAPIGTASTLSSVSASAIKKSVGPPELIAAAVPGLPTSSAPQSLSGSPAPSRTPSPSRVGAAGGAESTGTGGTGAVSYLRKLSTRGFAAWRWWMQFEAPAWSALAASCSVAMPSMWSDTQMKQFVLNGSAVSVWSGATRRWEEPNWVWSPEPYKYLAYAPERDQAARVISLSHVTGVAIGHVPSWVTARGRW
jgi:hypothetical protein